jgi:hypothetical protein
LIDRWIATTTSWVVGESASVRYDWLAIGRDGQCYVRSVAVAEDQDVVPRQPTAVAGETCTLFASGI